MAIKKVKPNVKLPTQRDIAYSFKNRKMSKREREFVEASMKVVDAMKREKERGVIW